MSKPADSENVETLPKFGELLGLLEHDPGERFIQLARTFAADDKQGDAQKNQRFRNQYAGKIICAARTRWEKLRDASRIWNQNFPEFFEALTGSPPSSHGSSCAKAYRSFVLVGMIQEADYDSNVSAVIELASRVVSRVDDDLSHPAVAAAAIVLRSRSKGAIKELKSLLDRLINDPETGNVKLLTVDDASRLQASPLGYVPALELAFKIANDGHHAVLAEPLRTLANSTDDPRTAQSLVMAANEIIASITENRDENGKQRFSDELVAAWGRSAKGIEVVTPTKLVAKHAAIRQELDEIRVKMSQAGLQVPETVNLAEGFKDPRPASLAEPIVLRTWRGAEQLVADLLRSRGWTAEDVSRSNLGYDVEGRASDGKPGYFEVKFLERAGRSFVLTNNEYAVATEMGAAYCVALVWQSGDVVEVALIWNPAETLKFVRQCRVWIWECFEYDAGGERFEVTNEGIQRGKPQRTD